ncbi:MAG: hypothetical protein LBS35_12710 [Synergistaceae bacterium]|jgi:hypothetical protein|nr:hypothetical protein [Synergistaceae bacterium]
MKIDFFCVAVAVAVFAAYLRGQLYRDGYSVRLLLRAKASGNGASLDPIRASAGDCTA